MAKRKEPVDVRFWKKVSKGPDDSCWLWLGYIDKDGYGTFNPESKTLKKAHRFSFELLVGDIPKGLCVCHKCDVPHCCNPKHLFLGTMADNDKDRDNKGRQAKGERSGNSRFITAQVLQMRSLRDYGMTQQSIANMYGTSQAVISCIVNRKTWKHI